MCDKAYAFVMIYPEKKVNIFALSKEVINDMDIADISKNAWYFFILVTF